VENGGRFRSAHSLQAHATCLVDLHRRINQSCEPETGAEADRTGEHTESTRGKKHVAKVQYARHHLGDLQLSEEVESGIQEEVDCR
jgi:hypothetical protein